MTRVNRLLMPVTASVALLLAIFFVSPLAVMAQDRDFPGWDRLSTRDRLLAERAARIRGMRDLSREVLNLQLPGGAIADLLGEVAADPDVAGRIIQGFKVDDPRYGVDGFARVAVGIATIQAWENLNEINPGMSRAVPYSDFRRAVGADRLEVTGLGRAPGFSADIRKHHVPPAPKVKDPRQGMLPPEEEPRFAGRDDRLPRERPLDDDEVIEPRREAPRLADRGWRRVEETPWRTVSETVVRTWEIDGDDDLDCDTAQGHWEVIEEKVLSRKVISQRIVDR